MHSVVQDLLKYKYPEHLLQQLTGPLEEMAEYAYGEYHHRRPVFLYSRFTEFLAESADNPVKQFTEQWKHLLKTQPVSREEIQAIREGMSMFVFDLLFWMDLLTEQEIVEVEKLAELVHFHASSVE